MKREQTVWLFIVILVILLAAMSHIAVTRKTSRLAAEPALKPSASDNKSEESGTVDIIIKQNQIETSKQTNISTKALSLIHPKVCIDQWRQELMSTEDALYCIDEYMESQNQT